MNPVLNTLTSTMGALVLMALLPANGHAQSFRIPDRIEKLSERAKESVNITLDGPLLQLAGQFLGANEQQIKQLVSNLRAIHVRNFEFANPGQFSDADLEPVRAQLRSGWARIIESRDDDEHVEIFVRQDKEKIDGLVIIAAESRELSIVHIDGPIDLRQLSLLGGHLGIPGGIIPNVSGSKPEPEPRPGSRGRKDGDDF